MTFIVDETKISFTDYKDVFKIYSYDNNQTVQLPWASKYLVMLKNSSGALPIIDYFDGDSYRLNESIYNHKGKNILEFIQLEPFRRTVLNLKIDNRVSAYNMNNPKIKYAYVPELEKAVKEVIEKKDLSVKEIEQKTKLFLNWLKLYENDFKNSDSLTTIKIGEVR